MEGNIGRLTSSYYEEKPHSMTSKTIWQWIRSSGWPSQVEEKIAIKYYHENVSESARILTHVEISKVTNEISQHISSLNIHEQLIIIDSTETCLTIPFLLGILQSNNSFFICDANWPENILRSYIMQLKPSLFVCQSQNKANIYDQLFDQAILSSITLLNEQIHFYKVNSQCCYENIAYVVASSGSTGIPKLIYVSHACLLPNLEQLKSIFDVTSNDCLFRCTPLTFDPSFIDIFLAIHCGASLCLSSPQVRSNPTLVSSIFDRSHCTIAQMTPSFFRQISAHCHMSQLKTLILGGEPFPSLSNVIIERMIRQRIRLVNIYGLTEMSCWASYYILNENDLNRSDGIPLGKALDQTSIVLQPFFDEQSKTDYFQIRLESQTRWTHIGELSSAKKFQFETDDLVRYDSSTDEIFYVGRRTLTLKRFGIMINLEYIESIAHQSNLLDECACLMLDENFLILLCKFREEPQLTKLDCHLKSSLSYHFLPNRLLPIQSHIPLNINGKIDRTKLHSIYLHSIDTPAKENLARIWQNLLNELPGRTSNFIFDGGNSMLALTFVEQIKQSNTSIDTNDLLDLVLHNNFEDLTEYLNNPKQQPQSIGYPPTSTFPLSETIDSNLTAIWSIQRCSKIFLHNTNGVMERYHSFPSQTTFSRLNLKLNWKSSMVKCIDASPVVVRLDEVRQYVIIGSHAGLVNAYRIDDGQLIWSFQASDRIEASGTISRNGQFFLIGDYAGMLYVLDCSNGELYSSYQCQGLIKTVPCIHTTLDIAYLGSHDHFIHAIHIQKSSSKCLWKYGLNSSCASSPQISADNNRLYVASLGGDIFGLQSNNGEMIWKQSLDKPIFSTIAIWKEKFLLIGCVDQRIYCLSCDNGEKHWTFVTNGPIFSSPCLCDNTLFLGCHDQCLYAIDLSDEQRGVLKWKSSFSSMIYASPFVFDHDRMVAVGSTDGCLRILDARTGESRNEIQMNGNGLFSSPICYLDFLIVGSRDDYLYCYKLSS